MQSRKVPTVNVDVLGKPDSFPIKQVGDYIESLHQNDLFIKTPVWDTIGEGLEEFYVNARLEHHVMLREKAALMEHQETQRKANESRLHELKRSQDELQEQFVRVNIFLREFAEKRNDALKKGTHEMAQQREIRMQNMEIQGVIEEFKNFRDRIQATADEYAPYEKVLEDVVKSSAFNSVKDLMDRCDALMLAQVEISELGNKKVLELETMRKRLVAISRAAALQALGLKNALSMVDQLYEAARSECLKWERIFDQVRATVNEGYSKRDRTLEGINQLYRLLCQRRSINPEVPYEAVDKRMGFIKYEVELLRDVLESSQKRNSETVRNKSELMC